MLLIARHWKWTSTNTKQLLLLAIVISLIGGLYLSNWQTTTIVRPLKEEFSTWVERKPKMDDPGLVEFVRKNYLIPPSTKPYNLSANSKEDPSAGQVKVALPFLSKTPGFFIECGAGDGEYLSNTLYLEKELGWAGLLVEADPINFKPLVVKNRKAWLSPTCLSLEKYPVVGTFYREPGCDNLCNGLSINKQGKTSILVECVPLYTLLLALNRTVVDFFSLDVEKSELAILKTVPFDKIIFKVIVLEAGQREYQEQLKEFLASNGYTFQKYIHVPSAHDMLFTHNSTTALTSVSGLFRSG